MESRKREGSTPTSEWGHFPQSALCKEVRSANQTLTGEVIYRATATWTVCPVIKTFQWLATVYTASSTCTSWNQI